MTTDNPASTERAPIAGPQPAISAHPEDLARVDGPHAGRFRLVLAALVGVAVLALAVAVVVLARHSGRNAAAGGVAWSSWAPDNAGGQGVTEIAEHLAPYYRLSAAQQLNMVTPIQVSQATAAGTTTGSGLTIAVNTASSNKSQSLELLNGKTVAYNVCGLGNAGNCAMAGPASTARMLLLRREALELALYTFRYISGVQNVVVVLPPGHAGASGSSAGVGVAPLTAAVAFDRAQLAPLLQVPLSRTLQQYPPEMPQLRLWSKGEEAGLVDQITAHALFSSQVQSQQVGGNLLVLNQLPPQ